MMVEISAADSIDGENTQEFEMRLTMADLSISDREAHRALMEALERDAADLRPVLSWEVGRAIVTLTTNAEETTAAQAAKLAVGAASDALSAAGLDSLYVQSVELITVLELNA